ncbi:MAG: hypothetical protein J6P99_03085 [Paludibacteraceae bacterium]|nr:hypothetical protein [Paludibacteraceae bacterium]
MSKRIGFVLVCCLLLCVGCGEKMTERCLMKYPGRTFDYHQKFNDLQTSQLKAAKAKGLETVPESRQQVTAMRRQLRKVESNSNYVVDHLTHSVPYLTPTAAAELDSIGEEFAHILERNGLPHYRFYVTSVLRTKQDVESLRKSGNINASPNSCHCYGTTFDLAYTRFDKARWGGNYMNEDNLKLVLGQVLLNRQRRGRIYVKYEKKQSCFHITCRL